LNAVENGTIGTASAKSSRRPDDDRFKGMLEDAAERVSRDGNEKFCFFFF